VKPGEIVEIAVKPSRPFRRGCVYEIMVGTFWYWERLQKLAGGETSETPAKPETPKEEEAPKSR
jgi:hypothetical protein